jgi:hypothetical protein
MEKAKNASVNLKKQKCKVMQTLDLGWGGDVKSG